MRVFVTGASGYIGNAVARAFRFNGHDVWGLVRSDEAALRLRREEIRPVSGTMENTASFQRTLTEADVWVHCAFDSSEDGVKKDAAAIDSFLQAAAQSSFPKTAIYTSGVWIYGNTKEKTADEMTPVHPIAKVRWRPQHEERFLKAENQAIRPIVIRPGCIYGGKGSLTALWFESAVKGELAVIGKGDYRWAMVHVNDLARLYVKAAEKECSGLILNGIDSSRNTVGEMMEAIRKLGICKTVAHLSEEEAERKYGALKEAFSLDQQVSSARAERLLGWSPRHQGFIHNVSEYYEAWRALNAF